MKPTTADNTRLVTSLPIADGGPVAELLLEFNSLPPEFRSGDYVAEGRAWYGTQARQCADALLACTPGGFVDALLGELLHRKATIFRVAAEDSAPVCGAKATRHNTTYTCRLAPGHDAALLLRVHDDGRGTKWSTTDVEGAAPEFRR